MIVAIMQPYFFPYLGYFQLMQAVDCFVFYDDAQYMKGGWVNRNRILHDGEARWWTYPVVRENFRLPICQRRFDRSPDHDASLLDKLHGAYRRAPYKDPATALVEDTLASGASGIASLNEQGLRRVAERLGIGCRFLSSSQIEHDRNLSGQARVLDICRRLGATQYLNAIGGVDLYDPVAFADAGIELGFVRPRLRPYEQFKHPHVPFLSVVDALMFNPAEAVRAMLGDWDRVEKAA